jgi:SAM-dependent methyltransferase
MRPAKLAVMETLRFVERALPSRPARVLDVGAGRGDISVELSSLGFAVTAIDRSEEAVLVSRSRGVETVHGDFFAYDAAPFDVILFSRSLHHLSPLGRAIDKAHALLAPGGLLLAEEFDLAAVDAVTALWHYDALALLEGAGVVIADHESAIPQDLDPLARWRIEHDHEPPLASANAMLEAIEARFEIVHVQTAPFLFRTACARMEESARGQRAAERLLSLERQRIERGLIKAVGWRCVARTRARAGDDDGPKTLRAPDLA